MMRRHQRRPVYFVPAAPERLRFLAPRFSEMRDLPRFLSYFRRRPGAYLAGFASIFASTGLFLAMPGIVRRAIEELGAGVTKERLFRLAALIVLLAVGDAIALFLTRRILIGASRHIEYEMRQDLFEHLLRLPVTWYRKNRVGDLMSRAVNDLSAVRMLLGPGIMQAANTFFVGVVALALMFMVSPALTGVALAVLPIVVGVGFSLTLWAGGRFILAGKRTVARYVEFNLYMIELIWPATALGWVVNLWQRGSASWNRMVDIWEAAPQPAEADSGERLSSDVEFRALSFAHGERAILSGVTFRVAPGTTVAVVGRTGAGKSTLLNLLLRLDDPPKGTIFIGGRDLTEIPLPVLRRNVVVVPQETFLFSDTLANNVAFGRPSATREEIERAVQAAGLAPDVARFPRGLDTLVGERGITLSGGQKQRTALARALLTGASVRRAR